MFQSDFCITRFC